MSTFGERVAKLRLKKGLSQIELATRLNIAKSTLAMYETNKREPSFEVVERIAQFFNVTTDYLITGSISNIAADPDQAEFLRWVEENLEDSFFYDFHKSPEEQKEDMMDTLRLLWERDKKRLQREKEKGE